jgi:hypothetical protein
MRPGYKVEKLREADLGPTLKERLFRVTSIDGSVQETR